MGSASIQSTFNIANSFGAYLGGLVIAGGFGLTAPAGIGVVLALVGLGFAALSGALDRRTADPEVVASHRTEPAEQEMAPAR
jgi:DHA1 family inner membrane transport protein